MLFRSSIVALAYVLPTVLAHGKLTNPAAFNRQPGVPNDSLADVVRGVGGNSCGVAIPPNPDTGAVLTAGQTTQLEYLIGNADGAGPMTVTMSTDGVNFDTPVTVTQQVRGVNGLALANKQITQLGIQAPSGVQCKGPNGNCIIMVANSKKFGACMAVKINDPNAPANSTAEAAPAATGASHSALPADQVGKDQKDENTAQRLANLGIGGNKAGKGLLGGLLGGGGAAAGAAAGGKKAAGGGILGGLLGGNAAKRSLRFETGDGSMYKRWSDVFSA